MDNASLLTRRISLEATLPAQPELDEIHDVLPRDTPIFVSAPPGRSLRLLVDTAVRIRRTGFEAIPHIAARSYSSRVALNDFLAAITCEAGARRVLVIAGDIGSPAGPFPDANSIIASGLLQRHGIREIGISGYPDGHPRLKRETLDLALRQKLNAAEAANIDVQIVTQFCFDANRIIAWLRSLRESGILVPVRIGFAGPTSARGLARYALRCGVRNSLGAALAGKASQLFAQVSPRDMIDRLGEMPDLPSLGEVSAHLFSFGGLVRTARWASSVQAEFGAASSQAGRI
jgi:methylenetetrahydrofolate reductase (NADH)